MKTILITGINGFLGSSLAKRLTENYCIIGTEYNLSNLYRIKGCDFRIYGTSKEDYESLFNEHKIDIIIHTATFYGRNNEDLPKILEANLINPVQLLDYTVQNHCELFINTDSALDRFTSVYSLTKKQFLDWLSFRSKEIKIVNMQLEHFYGPGASPSNFISLMIQKLTNNEPKIDLTLGEQKRDFIYYEDVVDAFQLVIQSSNEFENNYTKFEIGSGDSISIKDLMILLKGLTKSMTELNFGAIPYRENELMASAPDLRPIFNLGWRAKTNIKFGIQKTIGSII